MAKLTSFIKDVNNIQKLSDQPNTADGLTANELKERFDKAGADIKDYLNNTLIKEIDTSLANISGNYNSVAQEVAIIKGQVNDIQPDVNRNTNNIKTLQDTTVKTSDGRLTNSRQCNNSFDNAITARNNLKIKTGNSLPGAVEEDCLFFVYE